MRLPMRPQVKPRQVQETEQAKEAQETEEAKGVEEMEEMVAMGHHCGRQ